MHPMSNPFASPEMAAGYAADRPPLHAHILDMVRLDLETRLPVGRALDIGCGAGLSTAPLGPLAHQWVGLDPVAAMLAAGHVMAPGATFVVGSAERLPFASASIDLATAAGSLNFTAVDVALEEIGRVIRPRGLLVVYDWATASEFVNDPALGTWFMGFTTRYPRPPSEAVSLDPSTLSRYASAFTLAHAVTFTWPLTMTMDAYERYMMTETNVAAAVRGGTTLDDVRTWCHETLAGVFGGRPRDVLFRGYVAYLERRAEGAARACPDCAR